MMSSLRAIALAIAAIIPVTAVQSEERDQLSQALSEDLWISRDAYDASHILMVPMHRAFFEKDGTRISEFRAFVSRFLQAKNREELNRLTELQFSYLLSRFAVLDIGTAGSCSDTTKRINEHLKQSLVSILNAPAWLWRMPDFPTMFDRIEWRLEQDATDPSYLKAFFDEDLFSFAIAADLSTTLPKCGLPIPKEIDRAVELSRSVIANEGRNIGTGWVFQPGVWRDHPDYVYAGNAELGPGLPKQPVNDIGWDSSHSARFPLLLQSLRCAASENSEDRKIFDDAIIGLQRQLLNVVVLKGSGDFRGTRLANFMTGQNGIFRYNYKTIGPGGGYGPYGLSFTFNYGWWSFLGSGVADLYEAQVTYLPFAPSVLDLYLEPKVTSGGQPRPRNPLFSASNYLQGSLLRTVLTDAAIVARRGPFCS